METSQLSGEAVHAARPGAARGVIFVAGAIFLVSAVAALGIAVAGQPPALTDPFLATALFMAVGFALLAGLALFLVRLMLTVQHRQATALLQADYDRLLAEIGRTEQTRPRADHDAR